jgi:hypothetical protein
MNGDGGDTYQALSTTCSGEGMFVGGHAFSHIVSVMHALMEVQKELLQDGMDQFSIYHIKEIFSRSVGSSIFLLSYNST